MKKLLLSLMVLLFTSTMAFSQATVTYEIVYNATTCLFEAHAHVSIVGTPDPQDGNLGPSGFCIVVPALSPTATPVIATTSVNPPLAVWNDNSPVANITTFDGAKDYHKFATFGEAFLPGTFIDGADIVMFTFNYDADCPQGIRMFENTSSGPGTSPTPDTNPVGQTYDNSFQSGQTGEKYVDNVAGTASAVAPTLSLAITCPHPILGGAFFDVTPTITPNCTGTVAGGTGLTAFAPGYFGVATGAPYLFTVSDANGCEVSEGFTVDPLCNIFPIELLTFNVEKDGHVALLDWSTASEENNNHFIIEHSANGIDFESIGKVNSQNSNASFTQYYDYTHHNPVMGVNYYRLKQVDFDGEFSYSDIKTALFMDKNNLTLYPNPTNDIINVVLPVQLDASAKVEILNSTGQIVRMANEWNEGQLIQLNVENLADGFYFIQVRTSTQIFREQFIISN